jgi:hypothetical protein
LKREVRAALGRVLEDDRLDQRLGNVLQAAGAALQVIALAFVARAPGAQAHQLFAGQAGGEQGVAHLLPGRGVLDGLVLDAQIAQHFHGALVGDVGPRGVGQPIGARHHVDAHALGGQGQGGRAAGGAGADDQHVGVEICAGFTLGSPRRPWRADGSMKTLPQWKRISTALAALACKHCIQTCPTPVHRRPHPPDRLRRG